jgi:carbon-monoxide dehydrogenase medium subunit
MAHAPVPGRTAHCAFIKAMKPPVFEYVRAASVDDAIAALQQAGGDGKLLAGGQSLMPMLNFRLLRPSVLIDINRIPGLDAIEERRDGVHIGALARHHKVETSALVAAHFPVIAAAMAHVAHLAIRNRGTIGGSLAHSDPAAEWPMLCVLLGAKVKVRGAGGARTIAAADFHVGPLATALAGTELLEEVVLPYLPPGTGWGFDEVARRVGDFAIVAMGAAVTLTGGRVSGARIAITGVGDAPLRVAHAETILAGADAPDPGLLDAAAQAVTDAVQPNSDLHASGDYRRHLAGALTRRVVRAAFLRAKGETP